MNPQECRCIHFCVCLCLWTYVNNYAHRQIFIHRDMLHSRSPLWSWLHAHSLNLCMRWLQLLQRQLFACLPPGPLEFRVRVKGSPTWPSHCTESCYHRLLQPETVSQQIWMNRFWIDNHDLGHGAITNWETGSERDCAAQICAMIISLRGDSDEMKSRVSTHPVAQIWGMAHTYQFPTRVGFLLRRTIIYFFGGPLGDSFEP